MVPMAPSSTRMRRAAWSLISGVIVVYILSSGRSGGKGFRVSNRNTKRAAYRKRQVGLVQGIEVKRINTSVNHPLTLLRGKICRHHRVHVRRVVEAREHLFHPVRDRRTAALGKPLDGGEVGHRHDT